MSNPVILTLKEALSAWKTYLSTRQEAYLRKMDKRKEKAIQIAEQGFQEAVSFYVWVHETLPMNEDQEKDFKKLRKSFNKIIDKFNKYD